MHSGLQCTTLASFHIMLDQTLSPCVSGLTCPSLAEAHLSSKELLTLPGGLGLQPLRRGFPGGLNRGTGTRALLLTFPGSELLSTQSLHARGNPHRTECSLESVFEDAPCRDGSEAWPHGPR